MNTTAVYVRRGSGQDIRPILSLFKAVAPEYSRSETYYRWAHFDRPSRPSQVFVGTCDEGIVAHVAISPIACTGGAMAAFPQQVLVHPNYRSAEVITRLLHELNGVVRDDFDFGIGFPNAIFAPVLEKIGRWTRHSPISDIVVQPHRSDRISKTLFFRHLLSSEDVKGAKFPENEVNHGIMRQKRDADWMLWRYFDHPTEHYDVIGEIRAGTVTNYAVLKVFQASTSLRIGHVIEAGWDSRDSFDRIRESILSWGQYQAVARFTMWDTANHSNLAPAIGRAAGESEYKPVITNLYTYGVEDFDRAGLFMGMTDVY